MNTNGGDIADRIRGLIGGQGQSLAQVALKLGVDELALRISLDDVSPYPTVEVIAALVRAYGVDPAWLLTGEYDPEIHRAALESLTGELPAAVNGLLESSSPAIGTLAVSRKSRHPDA